VRFAVCSGGTFEEWRPDAADFLPADKGNPLGDWPGENYINILSPNVRQIMYKVRHIGHGSDVHLPPLAVSQGVYVQQGES
jgi:hypothetical protein